MLSKYPYRHYNTIKIYFDAIIFIKSFSVFYISKYWQGSDEISLKGVQHSLQYTHYPGEKTYILPKSAQNKNPIINQNIKF